MTVIVTPPILVLRRNEASNPPQPPFMKGGQGGIFFLLSFQQTFDGWSDLIGSVNHVDSSLFKGFDLILR